MNKTAEQLRNKISKIKNEKLKDSLNKDIEKKFKNKIINK